MGCGCGKKTTTSVPTTQPKQVTKRTPITPSKRIIKRTAK